MYTDKELTFQKEKIKDLESQLRVAEQLRNKAHAYRQSIEESMEILSKNIGFIKDHAPTVSINEYVHVKKDYVLKNNQLMACQKDIKNLDLSIEKHIEKIKDSKAVLAKMEDSQTNKILRFKRDQRRT